MARLIRICAYIAFVIVGGWRVCRADDKPYRYIDGRRLAEVMYQIVAQEVDMSDGANRWPETSVLDALYHGQPMRYDGYSGDARVMTRWLETRADRSVTPADFFGQAVTIASGNLQRAFALSWNVLSEDWMDEAKRNTNSVGMKLMDITGELDLYEKYGLAKHNSAAVPVHVAVAGCGVMPVLLAPLTGLATLTGLLSGSLAESAGMLSVGSGVTALSLMGPTVAKQILTRKFGYQKSVRGDNYSAWYHFFGAALLNHLYSSTSGRWFNRFHVGQGLTQFMIGLEERVLYNEFIDPLKRHHIDLAGARFGRHLARLVAGAAKPGVLPQIDTAAYLYNDRRRYGRLWRLAPGQTPLEYNLLRRQWGIRLRPLTKIQRKARLVMMHAKHQFSR